MPKRSWTNALIANGTSLSGVIDLGEAQVVAIVTPAAWTAAGLAFQGSVDGTNFFSVVSSAGAEATITTAVNQCILVTQALPRYIKVRSGTQGTPVNQGADRLLQLALQGS